jgi:hypothetical protein
LVPIGVFINCSDYVFQEKIEGGGGDQTKTKDQTVIVEQESGKESPGTTVPGDVCEAVGATVIGIVQTGKGMVTGEDPVIQSTKEEVSQEEKHI